MTTFKRDRGIWGEVLESVMPRLGEIKNPAQHQLKTAISIVIRQTFKIKGLANLTTEHLPISKEIANAILDLVKSVKAFEKGDD